eukprot:3842994-Amphidinium_carterae.1
MDVAAQFILTDPLLADPVRRFESDECGRHRNEVFERSTHGGVNATPTSEDSSLSFSCNSCIVQCLCCCPTLLYSLLTAPSTGVLNCPPVHLLRRLVRLCMMHLLTGSLLANQHLLAIAVMIPNTKLNTPIWNVLIFCTVPTLPAFTLCANAAKIAVTFSALAPVASAARVALRSNTTLR